MPERRRDEMLWQSSRRAEFVRYALSFAVVVAFGAGMAFAALTLQPSGRIASENDDAVLLDLAPAVASSAPQRDIAQGPEQQARDAAAAVAPATPTEVKQATSGPSPPKALDEKPPDEALQERPKVEPPKAEPPRDLPTPEVTPAGPPSAAAQAQDETGVSGAAAPTKDDAAADSEAVRARATKAITLWQKSMLRRIEIARNGMRTTGEYGSVEIAFEIARDGTLTASHIDRGSGSPRLDQAALALVRRASPFPAPPADVSGKQLIFKVPIVFARQR